ncbi:MAG: sugar ABC transporter ATP-binding protein [Chloroflexia bacterium]|nr:sugar ABC transporter ATP-binding protein [Chloroflexia bacterium]
MESNVILQARNISKRFGGVVALTDVNFSIDRGEIHALVGENGAGKSTMMKILAGVYQPDCGELILDGSIINFKNPKEAAEKGVSIVFQELNLFPKLSVYRNIFINRELKNIIHYWIPKE